MKQEDYEFYIKVMEMHYESLDIADKELFELFKKDKVYLESVFNIFGNLLSSTPQIAATFFGKVRKQIEENIANEHRTVQ